MAELIIFDTETTGLDHNTDRLVEIAGVDGRPISQDPDFEMLIDPGRSIPPEAKAVHHITEAMVQAAPNQAEAIAKMFHHFDYPKYVAAHNVKFDRGFVEPYLDYSPTWICTYKCAVMVWPDAPKHTNQVLRYWLDLKVDVPEGLAPHRALYDSLVTKAIFGELLLQTSLQQMVEWSNNPILLPKVPFGKHAGKRWVEVDRGYLNWIINNLGDNEDMVHTARHYLNGGRR